MYGDCLVIQQPEVGQLEAGPELNNSECALVSEFRVTMVVKIVI